MRALIILVNADRRALRHIEALLSEQGYLVAALPSFVEAEELLASVIPDLLIADIQLAAFNGLHLAIRSHVDHPNIPVILTHPHADSIFEAEALRYGARFVAAPLGNPAGFLQCVETALVEQRETQSPVRRWTRKRAAGAVSVNAAAARAEIVDMSYGGVRLAFSDLRDVPMIFDIMLPPGDVSVKARRVWTAPSAGSNQYWCGAELDEGKTRHWRDFVDAQIAMQ